ncbi:hypothetical protein BDZ45DRAFT_684679 [Acephala macrosclerotiorum]|nr:hypothetical protein BDZ45DRAFT_684679 [Acephala macrosclerotiorum]
MLKLQGKLELDLEDDGPLAFEILMNVAHVHGLTVPQSVDIKTLTQLAVVVDKYQALEALQPFVQGWIRDLAFKTKNPSMEATSVTLTCLTMCWVLKLGDAFKSMSKVAHQISGCQLTTDTLPIPSFVLERIEDARQQSITEILTFVQRMVTDFISGNGSCKTRFDRNEIGRRRACNAIILGTLITGLFEHGMWLLPEPPYKGVSLRQLLDKLRDLQILAGGDEYIYAGYSHDEEKQT